LHSHIYGVAPMFSIVVPPINAPLHGMRTPMHVWTAGGRQQSVRYKHSNMYTEVNTCLNNSRAKVVGRNSSQNLKIVAAQASGNTRSPLSQLIEWDGCLLGTKYCALQGED
jgi:hypothetical protein